MANVNQPEFEGKVAIVTGAASGIGRATATLLKFQLLGKANN
jgi:NAD(P)-dependent dehydrogenase (short-subunit alcohol dehydrogenase family)